MTDEISPRQLTVTRMDGIDAKLRFYWLKKGRLPSQLSDLPQELDRDNSAKDGRGKAIVYKVDGTKVVLSSDGGGAQRVLHNLDVTKEVGQK